jgi:two-component system nitrogen regulation sensor histidine kinase NtrY
VSSANNQSNYERQTRSRRRTVPWLLAGIVAILLAVIVAQQLFNLGAVVPPETGSDTLLLYALSSLNFAAFIVFSFILLRNLLKLRRERRERQLGSKIQTRLLVYFIGLSLLPITAMAVFSYLFLNRSIEKWMGRLPENVVERVREQQRGNLAAQNQKLRETATLLATVVKARPQSEWQTTLDQLAATGELSAIEIVSDSGAVVAHSEASIPDQHRAELSALLQRARGPDAQTAEALADGKGFDLTSVPLTGALRLVLVPHRLSDTDVNDTIAGSQSEYQHLVQRQRKVRLLGLSTLGLMTLLLLFASTWVAIHLARGFAAPIRSLAEASKEVARGNLSYRVETIADDELALLAESFNQMTAELDENRRHIESGAAALQEKNLALEERRNYIETVLESLSTGVVSLDENDCVTTINTAAVSMLKLSEAPPGWAKLASLLSSDDRVVIERLLRRARRAGRAAEQSQLMRGSVAGAIPVALTATALRGTSDRRGVVLVMEDLSELLAAQRAAAWSEVARRIAHEIKNPLTPIQLSAERIARNFRVRLHGAEPGADRGPHAGSPRGVVDATGYSTPSGGEGLRTSAEAEGLKALTGDGQANGNGENGYGLTEETRAELTQIVEECTTSITREVAGLKALVDEFSRFARMPPQRLEPGDVNDVIRQAVQLYQERLDGVELRLVLTEPLPAALLDSEQLKRVFVNLTDNALEALAAVQDERVVTITTRHDTPRDLLIAAVEDTGEGIPVGDFKRLFQPYFSTRGRGTGLGLAIVARIVTEHGGRVFAEANTPHGARFVIELPVSS